MDDELDRSLVAVRADTRGFSRDVAAMKRVLETGLGAGAERAAQALETALGRAVRTGKLGFGDLRDTALSALANIAQSALQAGLGAILGGGSLKGALSGLLGAGGGGSILSLLGGGSHGGNYGPRAQGGAVSPGRAFLVGERGPELFVPGASGRILPGASSGTGPREVRVAITVNAPAGSAPDALARSSRQIAVALKTALADRDA